MNLPVWVLLWAFRWELLVYTLSQPATSHLWTLRLFNASPQSLSTVKLAPFPPTPAFPLPPIPMPAANAGRLWKTLKFERRKCKTLMLKNITFKGNKQGNDHPSYIDTDLLPISRSDMDYVKRKGWQEIRGTVARGDFNSDMDKTSSSLFYLSCVWLSANHLPLLVFLLFRVDRSDHIPYGFIREAFWHPLFIYRCVQMRYDRFDEERVKLLAT